jgi:hypothetical protein
MVRKPYAYNLLPAFLRIILLISNIGVIIKAAKYTIKSRPGPAKFVGEILRTLKMRGMITK